MKTSVKKRPSKPVAFCSRCGAPLYTTRAVKHHPCKGERTTVPAEASKTSGSIGEFGRPRHPVTVETAGSNPAGTAAIQA